MTVSSLIVVHCGKPSKGCVNCRERKIRCGQEQPTCTNCAKASKTCPDYRNMLDLAFRNESSAVIERAKAKEEAKKLKASEKEQRSSKPSSATRTKETSRASSSSDRRLSSQSISASSSNYKDDDEFELNEILTAPWQGPHWHHQLLSRVPHTSSPNLWLEYPDHSISVEHRYTNAHARWNLTLSTPMPGLCKSQTVNLDFIPRPLYTSIPYPYPKPLNNLPPSTPNTLSNILSTPYQDTFVPCIASIPAETGLTPPPFSFPAAGAYFLVWPLYIPAVSRVTSPDDRTFACTALRRLTSDMGIAQGVALAHFIETSPRMHNSVKDNGKEFENRVKNSTVGLGRSIIDGDKMSKGMIKRAGPLPVYTYTRGINEIEV
ncbi:hypothetical protein EAF00_004231 [Botryotinia globosa]|nr:hypothetical protein EAF00_004231 [Botryotinia globosa]